MGLRLAREPGNLLTRLYRLAHRQQENFVTESFTHFLHHLCHEHPDVGAGVIEWLAGDGFLEGEAGSEPLRIRTQVVTDGFGVPDIRIESERVDMIVEVKLDGGITYGQLDAYRRALEAEGRERRALVALLGFRPGTELPEVARVRTWGELALFLTDQVQQTGSEATSLLVQQFVQLLNHLGLTPLEVRSKVSAGLREHREWADANPDLPALTRTRVRSTSLLQGMVGCEPLLELLLQIQHILTHADGVRVYRLDSGPTARKPWIGFNINDMEFFFFLWLDSPEVVTVQRYRTEIDPEAFDGTLGELDLDFPGVVRWADRLDLLDPAVDFFSRTRTEQVEVLREFFEKAFHFGRLLQAKPQPDAVGTSDL